uniref:Uncharacterized protein n=1 Tax=Avena sativa TaxID=4498 RepID=A0ACD6AJM9_AVESA
MAGTSDRRGALEDWMLPTPSPRTLMLSLFNDDFSSDPFSDVFGDSGSKDFVDSSREETTQVKRSPLHFEPGLFGANEKADPNNGSPAEKNGFCTLKIDTSRVGYSASIRSPIMIPAGVSPRELLESPVFLPNAITQPSPTTGRLPFLMRTNAKPAIPRDDRTFSFQHIVRSKPPSSPIVDKGSSVTHQNEPSASESDHRIPDNEQEDSEANRNGDYSSAPIISHAEDGYNWRKYGKRQVKNSDHPTSYYKCTHQNCPVKKKVERCQDGDITEIVYKGSHNHRLPPPDSRPGVNELKADDTENVPNDHFQDVHGEVGIKLSASPNTGELADTSVREAREIIDLSSTISSEDDDREMHDAISLGSGRDEDATRSKRRMVDFVTPTTTISTIDIAALASTAVREARVVVQTTSDVDILDDGYRWRKYGQKVVKGNPNPRSYYKCTHPGCSVRKHVERASNDLKSVITTYEGKHTHEVPAARNNGHPSVVPPGAPLSNGLHRRPEPAPGSLAQFPGAPAYGSPGQFGSAGGFSFGMLPNGMAVVPVQALRAVLPMQMPGHPLAMQGYPRLVLQTGEANMNPAARPGLPPANGNGPVAYQQLMGRLSQDHQM